jgi:hypothetical protein
MFVHICLLQDFSYVGLLDIWLQELIIETYFRLDGKCIQLEMEFTIIISKREDFNQELTNSKETIGCDVHVLN